MISRIPFEVWYCDECGTVWLPRRGTKWEKPKRCPNRACRKVGKMKREVKLLVEAAK